MSDMPATACSIMWQNLTDMSLLSVGWWTDALEGIVFSRWADIIDVGREKLTGE